MYLVFRDIFLSQKLSNQRALEQVVYFLLSRIDAKRCTETFRDCWPIPVQGDRQYEKEFRSRACDWLRELATAEQFFEPKLIASMLHSPSGEKLYDFLVQCSTYVLIELAKREYASVVQEGGKKETLYCLRPAMVTKYTSTATRELSERIAQSAIERNMSEFLAHMREVERVFSTFRAAFDEHVRIHERLFTRLRRAEATLQVSDLQAGASDTAALKKVSAKAAPKASAAAMFDEAANSVNSDACARALHTLQATPFASDCVSRVHKATELWHTVDHLLQLTQQHATAILREFASQDSCNELAETTAKVPLALEADEAFRNAHDPLVRATKRELRRVRAENVLVGDRVSLRGLVQLAGAAVTRHVERLSQLGVSSLPRCVADWRNELATWSRDFANLETRLRELRCVATQCTAVLHCPDFLKPNRKQ